MSTTPAGSPVWDNTPPDTIQSVPSAGLRRVSRKQIAQELEEMRQLVLARQQMVFQLSAKNCALKDCTPVISRPDPIQTLLTISGTTVQSLFCSLVLCFHSCWLVVFCFQSCTSLGHFSQTCCCCGQNPLGWRQMLHQQATWFNQICHQAIQVYWNRLFSASNGTHLVLLLHCKRWLVYQFAVWEIPGAWLRSVKIFKIVHILRKNCSQYLSADMYLDSSRSLLAV